MEIVHAFLKAKLVPIKALEKPDFRGTGKAKKDPGREKLPNLGKGRESKWVKDLSREKV